MDHSQRRSSVAISQKEDLVATAFYSSVFMEHVSPQPQRAAATVSLNTSEPLWQIPGRPQDLGVCYVLEGL